jgi:hypothetical protein
MGPKYAREPGSCCGLAWTAGALLRPEQGFLGKPPSGCSRIGAAQSILMRWDELRRQSACITAIQGSYLLAKANNSACKNRTKKVTNKKFQIEKKIVNFNSDLFYR